MIWIDIGLANVLDKTKELFSPIFCGDYHLHFITTCSNSEGQFYDSFIIFQILRIYPVVWEILILWNSWVSYFYPYHVPIPFLNYVNINYVLSIV
jgi:hypothetical protein